MANRSGADLQVLLLGGYDLRPNINTLPAYTKSAVVEDTTPFGVQDQQQTYAGKRMAAFEIKGFFDDAALASNAALSGLLGASAPLCIGIAGNVVGRRFTGATSIQASYERGAAVGKVTYVDAKLAATGEIDEGIIEQPQGAVTANGSSAGNDGTASSAFGLVAYLQVSALTLGTATSLTVTMQDSADNVTWANIAGGAFAALSSSITTTPAAQRLVIAGTIRRYTRAIWAFGGSVGGGTTATIFVGSFRGATAAVSAVAPFAENGDAASQSGDNEAPATSAAGDAAWGRPPRRRQASPAAGTAGDTDGAADERQE